MPVIIRTVLAGCSDAVAAHGTSIKEVLQQLKELLIWQIENEPWHADPDLSEPELVEVKVELQPQYSEEDRVIPCPDTLWVRVPCVVGIQENGLRACTVPLLDIRFNYHDVSGLKSLAAHYIRDDLQGLTPLQLSGRLPPCHCVLDEVTLSDANIRVAQKLPADRSELKLLFLVAEPMLHAFARKKSSPTAFGREQLSAMLAQKFENEKANILLVGDSGIGKSTLLLDAVKKAARKHRNTTDDEEDADMNSYRYWRGNAGRMIAGMKYLGEWEERCEKFVQKLNGINGVFCAENLLELTKQGGQGAGDSVAAFLLPYLQRGELRMMAEATPAEVEACRRIMPGLLDVFQIFPIPPFNDIQAVDVLSKIANAYSTSSQERMDASVVLQLHRLFKRFFPQVVFPGPAASFIRTLCERSSLNKTKQNTVITAKEVVSLFIKQTGLPELFLCDEIPLVLEQVRGLFDSRIIGQPDATLAAARLTTKIKAGLTDPGRPFGVLLFCGPTGVGKTALAKELADFCFGAGGAKDRLIRLDMSEYASWGAAIRLLQGSNGNPAAWIENIRRQPFCVLLLDEIEKAATEVFDVLLGILDEGRLTDQYGRVTSFRSAIIIMTSNIGASSSEKPGFNPDSSPAYESEAAKYFRPEFFNRLDGVITFNPLGSKEITLIALKELNEIGNREGFATSDVRLEFSERLLNKIIQEGYDHRFGARPLQRTIERLVVTPLARWKLEHPNKRNILLKLDLTLAGQINISCQ